MPGELIKGNSIPFFGWKRVEKREEQSRAGQALVLEALDQRPEVL